MIFLCFIYWFFIYDLFLVNFCFCFFFTFVFLNDFWVFFL